MKPSEEEKDWIVEYRNFSGTWELSGHSRDVDGGMKYRTKEEAERLCKEAHGINGLSYRARRKDDTKLKKHSLSANQKWTIEGRLGVTHLEEILHVLRETGEVHITSNGEVPSLFELILDKFANVWNQMTTIIRSLNAESAHKKEVWIVEFLRGGEWVSSYDFTGEYWTKEEAERAYSQATNGCTYRAVRKNG